MRSSNFSGLEQAQDSCPRATYTPRRIVVPEGLVSYGEARPVPENCPDSFKSIAPDTMLDVATVSLQTVQVILQKRLQTSSSPIQDVAKIRTAKKIHLDNESAFLRKKARAWRAFLFRRHHSVDFAL